MSSTPSRLKLLAAAAAAGLLAFGIAQVAAGHARRSRQHHHVARARASSAFEATAYAVLMRAPTHADEENQIVIAAASHYPPLLPNEARMVLHNSIGWVWLMPTNDGDLCIGLQPGPGIEDEGYENEGSPGMLGFTCSKVAKADVHGLGVRVYHDVVEAVPDGVTTVTLKLEGKPARQLSVEKNIYEYSMANKGYAEHVTSFTLPSGAEVVDPL